MHLSLVVIRVSDLDASRRWYEALGLSFVREQHGNGPVHYAAEHGAFVFELYPASAKNPVSAGVRLGFAVPQFDEAIAKNEQAGDLFSGPDMRDGRRTAVLVDPNGIKVEIAEPDEPGRSDERNSRSS